ncbi:UDP-N-acetylmuramyl-tripeptide synthetase [Psychrobacillus glaciei]|uniref:UDP-N-acetylmuramyl-tripeptide synthetase n=1 Tax=Psychrobacillus glaciei TaxID=2283160 RepID=A0A5J6SSC9_9BACI|nr:UDP-N-acetylmuramyl-tripeptide synthetase [Psychrobacillus glaciei]QFG00916.1 UDP-N-acetylmuramyl-tripeptide synthetase [Psychrobacillus glaciei]
MELTKLMEHVNVKEVIHTKQIDIAGLAYNSRKVEKGQVFVCVRGFKADGHQFAGQAVENGAIALVVEEFIEGLDVPQYKVESGRNALATLADAYYDHPTQKLKTIGITATNGKTSTSFMTNAILENNGLKTGLMGTVVVKIGDYAEPSELTTPESLDLQRFYAQMVDAGVSHATMEVSSSALELNRVGCVDFDIVTLNNISREHIDLHSSFENYFEHKSSLIRNAGADKVAILNLDDKYSASLVNKTKAKVITIGVEEQSADVICRNLDLSTGRAKFTVDITRDLVTQDLVIPKQHFQIELSTPGFHSVYNSMVSIVIGLLCEVPIETIQKSLYEFVGVERRFEIIFEDDFKIIDDHFANSGNIDITLGTLEKMDFNRVSLVYAIRGDRGVTVNKENAEAIARWAPRLGIHEVIATLSRSHVTQKDIVSDAELAVFKEVMEEVGINVHLYEELPDAIGHSLQEVTEGDLLLLAGCQGMDYGAKIALEQLETIRPNMDKKKLFQPLEKRVAGNS